MQFRCVKAALFSFLRKSVFSRSALRQHRSQCHITSVTSGTMQNQFLLSLWQHPAGQDQNLYRGFTRMNADKTRILKTEP